MGTIYIFEGKNSRTPLSKAHVYFSPNAQGTVSLYSPNIKIEKNNFSYCGAPVEGAKEYSGDFYLSFGKLRLSLGRMVFVENTSHGGNFIIKQLDRENLRRDFIILLQYGTCCWEFAKIYGYDFKKQNLIQYSFKWHNANLTRDISFSWTKDSPLKILPNKDLIFRVYDNSICKFRVSEFRLNNKENIFEEVEHWIEPLDENPKIYSIIEDDNIPREFENTIDYKIDSAEFKIFPLKIKNNEFGYFEAYNKGEKIYTSEKIYSISGFLVFKYKDNKYIIIKEDSGGAHCCFNYYVFLLNEHELKLIKIFDLGNGYIPWNRLLEKDNKLYLAVKDDRFAYFHVCFADSYFFNRYYLIKGEELIERNIDFKEELIAEALKCENELNEIINNEIINKDAPANYGLWMRLFLGKTVNYILAGEPEKANENLEALEKYYTTFYASRGLREVMEEIMAIMQQDKSSMEKSQ